MRPENNCIVIFGASGDLTRRKLIPALFHLFKNNQLPEKFAVLGVSRTELDDDTFREAMRRNLIEKEGAHGQTLEAFCTHLYYQSIDTADRDDYAKLLPRLDTLHMNTKRAATPSTTSLPRRASTASSPNASLRMA